MSELEPYTEGIFITPKLRVRISEIMEEKGKAFSQNAIAIRIGMNYETLRKKLRGENKITRYELRRIAEALHLTVERLLQEDTKESENELHSIFDALINPEKTKAIAQRILWKESTSATFVNGGYVELLGQRALEIALKLSSVAVGLTERSTTLNDVGRAYFYLHRMENAHTIWLQAYDLAKKLANQKKPDTEPLYAITANLLVSFSSRKEYSHLQELLSNISHLFVDDPARAAVISYSLAKIAENKGDIEEARKQYRLYIHYSESIPNKVIRLGKAKHNTARFEFRQRNYLVAKAMFEEALVIFEHHHFAKITCLKEYSKTLLKLDDYEYAEHIISKTLGIFDGKNLNDLHAQYLILLSIARNVSEHAELVFEKDNVSDKIKKVACNYLIHFFDQKGDSSSAMKYYRAIRQFSGGHYDALDEEEL